MSTFSNLSIHKEIVLEQILTDNLVNNQGYVLRDSGDFDKFLALDKDLVLKFIKHTQIIEWQRLEKQYSTASEAEFFKQLTKGLKQRGTLDVLRNGIKLVPGIKFSLCFFKPASKLNLELSSHFEANILSCIRQVRYSLKSENAIDVVLFVNGIPIVTLELKNLLTGSSFKTAEKQYKYDRQPAGEPLLTFKQGALVHFALDEDNVSMTTRLANGKTMFLPFNRGREEGAGNPDIENEFRVAYLYKDLVDTKAVFSKDILLDIIGKFIHFDTTDGKEVTIFPRYQQLDAVLKILEHAKSFGSGHNYLLQHSAGSGKSNTIGWAAHRLITLHDDNDQPIFETVIIVTDRIVLDRQLQNTVAQFAQTKGVVKKIDGTSKQLKEAILKGSRIIITTIHKFSTDHLREISGLSNRKFAILIDEAHGSQSGSHADNLAKVLSREDQNNENLSIEDVIADYQRERGPQPNISYFAFTATPRNVTLERFGTKGNDGLPHPFHLYSMRQAIEEGFILDVLQNYMTYGAYYKLEKAIDKDPTMLGRQAQRKVARFASLHPTAIAQKVEVIVEHFKRHVLGELEGQAKAMVVTQSREHAIKYYFGIKKYITDQNYNNIKAIVAFSGEINVNQESYTEAGINGFAETELPVQFDGIDYRLLIVAEKYQTGFDQPKLCAMYVDRKLNGLQAVQTLSRLNRTYAGKENTYILDFQNSIEDIQNAFKPYFERTALEAISDPNQIYELESRIQSFHIIDEKEINRFAEIYYNISLEISDRITLEAILRLAVDRFRYEDEKKQDEFRQLLKSFIRFYSFVAQVVRLEDTNLEKLFSYLTWLMKLLPSREVPMDFEITDNMLRLQAFRVEKKQERNASLVAGSTTHLNPIDDFGANSRSEDEEISLSEIVDNFNQKHGTTFSKDDFLKFEKVNADLLGDGDFKDMLKNNPHDVVFSAFSYAFFDGVIKLFQRENQFQNIVMTDADARNQAISHFFNKAIKEARQSI
ncbi:type I restriction endonuclease subunit R [Pedobacter alluvionis]|uniref:Type I restriction endonuclease subunit R n=1 Tax=Pedobacter alluvionis TaxID=475253 RepID=A0A497Y5Y2_9SPHI|nr:DEAD/DEAH box helicase family protein [Pedobacter alluvionis]RLJ77386.1 type I restriction enzyme R subunit [Pedobacter alluvionis]TFB33396.1 type I restriction endonuclease subunit R [Pedobacter alluvionis]